MMCKVFLHMLVFLFFFFCCFELLTIFADAILKNKKIKLKIEVIYKTVQYVLGAYAQGTYPVLKGYTCSGVYLVPS